jgi:UDP-glucose 4-epimerase
VDIGMLGEAILSDLAVADPEWTIIALRYFNPVGCDGSGVLGEDPRTASTNLMPSIIKVMTGQMSHLNIYGTDFNNGDGTAVRDYIHVSNLARTHLAALAANDLRGFRAFNVGAGEGFSVKEVFTLMEVTSGIFQRRSWDAGKVTLEDVLQIQSKPLKS